MVHIPKPSTPLQEGKKYPGRDYSGIGFMIPMLGLIWSQTSAWGLTVRAPNLVVT